MALEVWYKTDIQNALNAAELSCAAALGVAGNSDDPFVAGFEAGHRTALMTVSLAFGLTPRTLQLPVELRLAPDSVLVGGCTQGVEVEASVWPPTISRASRPARRTSCRTHWKEE